MSQQSLVNASNISKKRQKKGVGETVYGDVGNSRFVVAPRNYVIMQTFI